MSKEYDMLKAERLQGLDGAQVKTVERLFAGMIDFEMNAGAPIMAVRLKELRSKLFALVNEGKGVSPFDVGETIAHEYFEFAIDMKNAKKAE